MSEYDDFLPSAELSEPYTSLYREVRFLPAMRTGAAVKIEIRGCSERKHYDCPEVVIAYAAADGQVYGITCYLVQYPPDYVAVAEMALLNDYAHQLVQEYLR